MRARFGEHIDGVAAMVLVLLGLAAATPATSARAAGAWAQPSGGHFLKVWDRTLVGDRGYFANGDAATLPHTYQDHTLELYGEYGLAEGWTLLGSARPVGWAHFGDESTAYVGPFSVGVRRALLTAPVALAVEARYGYASGVGDEDLAAERGAARTFAYRPVLETHLYGVAVAAGYGLSWGWASVSAGVTGYTRDSIDTAADLSAQVGWKSDFGFVASLAVDYHQPFGDVRASNVSGAGQTRYLGLNVGASYALTEHLAVTIGVGGAALAESNAATPALSLGFELR